MVAGIIVDLQGLSFRFGRCLACGFLYKDPPVPEERLLACYRQSKADQWGIGASPHIRKYTVMRDLLEKHSRGRRVLDIGCSNGDFLDTLGPTWQRAGVEPGASAAAAAEKRGIAVLGATITDLDSENHQFDVITAIDVIEHIVNPIPFFKQISALLAQDGLLWIITGDSRALSWRWCGNTYWYGGLPEHTSFYCRTAIDHLGGLLGMRCVYYRREQHALVSPRQCAIELTKNACYKLGRMARGLGIPRLRWLFVERGAPAWLSAKDHMFCLLRKC